MSQATTKAVGFKAPWQIATALKKERHAFLLANCAVC